MLMIAAHLSLPLNCNAVPRAINGMLRSMYDGVFIFAISHGAFSQEPPLTDYVNPPCNLYIQSNKLNGEAWIRSASPIPLLQRAVRLKSRGATSPIKVGELKDKKLNYGYGALKK
ncbi:MAG: hypothetical protein CRN43_18490 [Candidatus Nephrothrix sp. EaCA]|nr:MAG: hypothetical protein CRN43_18490 [Candidatus Nephrothrix sp. EaCA]